MQGARDWIDNKIADKVTGNASSKTKSALMCAALSADTVDNLKDFDFSKTPQR